MSIRKRGKNSWEVRISYYDKLTGQRKWATDTVRGSERDAKALERRLLHERDTGISRPAGRETLADYLTRWLADYADTLAPKTALSYRDIVERHLIPFMGAVKLGDLRADHIQAYHSHALQRGRLDGKGGLDARSVLRHHRVLRRALYHAVKRGKLAVNPADGVETPRTVQREVAATTLEEVNRLLAAAEGTEIGRLVYLAAATGMRQGELLGLRWQDINLDSGVLSIQQVCQWLPRRGFIFKEPKTASSRRAVALSPATVLRLREHRARCAEVRLPVGTDLVFTAASGGPIDPSNLRRAWKKLTCAAQLPRLRFHDVRHAHATLLLASGANPKVVSTRLGHAGIGITLNTYGHVLPGADALVAASFDAMLDAEKRMVSNR